MTMDLDTFLVALYTTVDDLYRQHFSQLKPRRRGKRPELSDSEVLTLAICAQWHGTSERAFLRFAHQYWRAYFPRLLSQSACNRRCRDLAGVLTRLSGMVAQELGAYAAAYQVLDTRPVVLMRRCRGERRRLFGYHASVGKGGSDRDWYYGCKLLLSLTPAGSVTGFLLAPANAEDLWIAEAFLCWRREPAGWPLDPQDLPRRRNGQEYVGPTGPLWPRFGVGGVSPSPYLADDGFFGSWWQRHWRQDYRAVVLTAGNYTGATAPAIRRQHHRRRQIVETINGRLEGTFNLNFPRARTPWGLLTRVAAKVCALNLGIWLNRQFGRPGLAFATLLTC